MSHAEEITREADTDGGGLNRRLVSCVCARKFAAGNSSPFCASAAMAAVASLAVVLLVGCGADAGSPTSVARSYEKAIIARDGKSLCATFAPKLREILGEQLTSQQSACKAKPEFFERFRPVPSVSRNAAIRARFAASDSGRSRKRSKRPFRLFP